MEPRRSSDLNNGVSSKGSTTMIDSAIFFTLFLAYSALTAMQKLTNCFGQMRHCDMRGYENIRVSRCRHTLSLAALPTQACTLVKKKTVFNRRHHYKIQIFP